MLLDVDAWVTVTVHDSTADHLGVALVPMPVELGDEIALADDAWPFLFEIVDIVSAPPGRRSQRS